MIALANDLYYIKYNTIEFIIITYVPCMVWFATRSYLMVYMSTKTSAASTIRRRSWAQASLSSALKRLAAAL